MLIQAGWPQSRLRRKSPGVDARATKMAEKSSFCNARSTRFLFACCSTKNIMYIMTAEITGRSALFASQYFLFRADADVSVFSLDILVGCDTASIYYVS